MTAQAKHCSTIGHSFTLFGDGHMECRTCGLYTDGDGFLRPDICKVYAVRQYIAQVPTAPVIKLGGQGRPENTDPSDLAFPDGLAFLAALMVLVCVITYYLLSGVFGP